MNRLRNNNAPIFVTVLSACLGLIVAGAPSRVHRTASSVLSEIAAATSVNLSYSHSSKQTLRLAATFAPSPLTFVSQSETEPSRILYQSRTPLAASNRILVVTRLARASLNDGLSA